MIADLRVAEAQYRRALQRAEDARLERNAAIQRALEAGCTHALIAKVTGLTRGRIGQLAMRSK